MIRVLLAVGIAALLFAVTTWSAPMREKRPGFCPPCPMPTGISNFFTTLDGRECLHMYFDDGSSVTLCEAEKAEV